MRGLLRSIGGTNRALQRVELAWALTNLAEWAYVTALSISAYRQHGALALGLIGARFAPGAVLGSVIVGRVARMTPPRVLRALSLGRCVVVGGAVAATVTHAPLGAIVAIVWIDAVLSAPYRPVQSSLLPALSSTPHELSTVAGNIPATKALAQAIGALLGSLLLTVVPVETIIAGSIGVFAVVAVLSGSVTTGRPPPLPERTRGESPAAQAEGIAAGFRSIGRNALALLVLGGTRSLTRGLWTSLTVVASLRLLHLGSAGVGLLMAAAGVGAVIAMSLSGAMAGRAALTAPGAVAFALAGIPITLVGLIASPAAAVALVVIWGAALSLADSISNSLVHRVVDARVLAPSVAAIESSKLLLEGIGALIAPALLSLVGVRDALIIAGAPLPLLVLASYRGLVAVDARAIARARPLAALRRAPSFRGLTMLALESIASRLQVSTFGAGVEIVRQGEMADRFYLIDTGQVSITVDGYWIATMGTGGSFGEKALLRASPRNATVTTLDPTSAWHLDAADFIAAATGSEGPVALRAQAGIARTVADLLDEVALFGAIDRRRLASMGHEISSPAGQDIVRQGEPASEFFVLIEGSAHVAIDGRSIRTLEAGDSFGEIALLHSVPRTATVTATADVRLWKLARVAFLAAVSEALPAGAGDDGMLARPASLVV